MKTLFAYTGGKSRQAKWISGVIDTIKHKCYVEPFCGSAAVLWAKKPTKIEIINDNSDDIVRIFKALRDHTFEFIDYCHKIEYSRANWDYAKEILKKPDNYSLDDWENGNIDEADWEKAAWAYYVQYNCYSGNPCGPMLVDSNVRKCSWDAKIGEIPDWARAAWGYFQMCAAHGACADAHSMKNDMTQDVAGYWEQRMGKLGWFADRLKHATILNRDAIGLIKLCDKPGVLFYLDPPYHGAEQYYKKTKDGFNHASLHEVLMGLKHAKFILSHYYKEPYIELYKNCKVEKKPSKISYQGSKKKKIEEALFINA